MKMRRVLGLALMLIAAPAWAQSLKPETPSPLQPGINKSTADNFVGTQYWYFTGGPGKTHVHASFTPMALLGNPSHGELTITLYDEGNTWHTSKVLSSDQKMVDCTFDGDLKKPTKVMVSVAPPSGGLVRMGGDYQLVVTGEVAFGQKSNKDPIVGVYNQMCGYTSLLGSCKFLEDGTIQTSSGARGSWQLFDRDSQTYVVNIDKEEKHSLRYKPGRGLVDTGEAIVFQEMR